MKAPDSKTVITEIQSWGIRVPTDISGRKSGAGPAEGRAFIYQGVPVNAPISADYTAESPYHLRAQADGSEANENRYQLLKNDRYIGPIEVVPSPSFYQLATDEGIPYGQIALLHGRDCLATTILQRCDNWRRKQPCAFCGIELSLQAGATIAHKTPAQLAEVTAAARARDGITHVVLTAGVAETPGAEIAHLAACTRSIKSATGIPVHVQFPPPADLGAMDCLIEAGVDTVGIHIESCNETVLARMAPAKAALGIKRYEAAWKQAVRLFGPNQVSSFLIAGLGESPESIVAGSERLADLGVYPFVVPLRPIPGSPMQHHRPPAPNEMAAIYEAVAGILRCKGLSAAANKAGCVRCGACSALATYEQPQKRFRCHSTRTESEEQAAYAIRHAVFVKEQGLFQTSDRDEHDPASIHLVAREDDDIIGTVRVYAANANGLWIGGRLAVKRDNRVYRVGAMLVKEAMKRVKKQGCQVFQAHIQTQNVPFFKRLGWIEVGAPKDHCGQPHQLMQADLGCVPPDL